MVLVVVAVVIFIAVTIVRAVIKATEEAFSAAVHVLSIVLEVTLIALGILAAVAILSVVGWIAIRIYGFLAKRPHTRRQARLRASARVSAPINGFVLARVPGPSEYLRGSGRMAVDPPEGSARQLPRSQGTSAVVPLRGQSRDSGDLRRPQARQD